MRKMSKKPQLVELLASTISNSPKRDDIVGQAGIFVDDFILSMNSESIYKKMGVNPDKTFLLTGKPGTGKTIGVQALINEVNTDKYMEWLETGSISPGLYGMPYDIGRYGTAYINMGSKIAQTFFDKCFSLANKSKVLVIFDEAEVLFGDRRNNNSHKEDSKLLNTIMKNMQRLHDTDNMYAVLMSNYPDAFDTASIRAGRIDKKYEFLLPNQKEREFAYNHTIQKLNNKAGYKVIRDYDINKLSKLSKEYSYADIVESVNSAVRTRAKQISVTREKGTVPAGYISQKRLEDSVGSHRLSFYKTKRSIGFL